MKDNLKGLVGVWTFTMVLMAAMMVPGLLMQPTIVRAWDGQSEICSPDGGVTGCLTCPSSSGFGCNGIQTSPAPGYSVGICVYQSSSPTECMSQVIDCGSQEDCLTGKSNGRGCAGFIECAGNQ